MALTDQDVAELEATIAEMRKSRGWDVAALVITAALAGATGWAMVRLSQRGSYLALIDAFAMGVNILNVRRSWQILRYANEIIRRARVLIEYREHVERIKH